jgi:hypothetical protein
MQENIVISDAVSTIDDFIEVHGEYATKEAWQTLKTAVLAQLSHNTGSPKLRENTMERLEAVSTIIGGTSVLSREELDCASEELDYCIAQLRSGA